MKKYKWNISFPLIYSAINKIYLICIVILKNSIKILRNKQKKREKRIIVLKRLMILNCCRKIKK